jgi:hypothetical protein
MPINKSIFFSVNALIRVIVRHNTFCAGWLAVAVFRSLRIRITHLSNNSSCVTPLLSPPSFVAAGNIVALACRARIEPYSPVHGQGVPTDTVDTHT